jgi:flagella basal body P-ring formation protein FlgA
MLRWKTLFLLLFFLSFLQAKTVLDETILIQSDTINISDIIPHAMNDALLYELDTNRYTKRVKAEDVIQKLREYGYHNLEASSRYINFIKQSPINMKPLEEHLLLYYKEHYPSMRFNSLRVTPRGYVQEMQDAYAIVLPKRAHLKRNGTLYVKTDDKKKIFFDYTIDATVEVSLSKQSIRQGASLSKSNTTTKHVPLDRFRDELVLIQSDSSFQSKHHIRANEILTIRDVEKRNLVLRGATVSVKLLDNNMNIEFSAQALEDGKLNDIITVQNSKERKMKAKVIGQNLVEVQ